MSLDTHGTGESRSPTGQPVSTDISGLAIAAGLFLLAFLIWWDASGYPERRNYAQFGPEIFPYLVAAGLAIFGALTVVMAVRNWFPEREAMSGGPVAWIVAAIVAEIALLMSGFGFIVGSGFLFGLCARGMGRRPVWLTVLAGLVVSLLLYILFRHGLGLSLPAGPLERVVDAPFRR
jgi:putative tricarboxylic transport membrane protein